MFESIVIPNSRKLHKFVWNLEQAPGPTTTQNDFVNHNELKEKNKEVAYLGNIWYRFSCKLP